MKKFVIILLVSVFLAGCATSKSDIERYKGYSARELLTTSEVALAKRDNAKAVDRLQALNTLYPFGPYSQQGMLDLIYAYYAKNEMPSALAVADRYVRLYPRSDQAAYAYYMKGLINFNAGETWLQHWLEVDPSGLDLHAKKQAFMDFNTLVSLYPNSVYSPSAVHYMTYIRNTIARKQLLIAEFYFKRVAYVGAANRAMGVVEHFDGSPDVVQALALLVKCYQRMHLYGLADNTTKILVASYPDSKQARKLMKKLPNPHV